MDRVVYVLDDSEEDRKSVAAVLERGGYAVRTFARAEMFLRTYTADGPACVLADVGVRDCGGLELLRRVRARGWSLAVVLASADPDAAVVVEAFRNGAADFFLKPFPEAEFLRRIAALFRGLSPGRSRTRRMLSPRERQVLEGVVSGKTNKLIAYELRLSPKTVEVHRARLMRKLGASSVAELVRLGLFERGSDPEAAPGSSRHHAS
ncbi:MAG: DNA-binding response regulator [Candidatus Binatia bacterium]|nr:MAG: DNA-binding response regulator [Candidatus Binatia bacterium]